MSSPQEILADLLHRRPDLKSLGDAIWAAYAKTEAAYASGGKLLLCGNGGSASDAEHIAGELMKGFLKKRPIEESLRKRLAEVGGAQGEAIGSQLQQGMPAISLVSQTALATAVINDISGDMLLRSR